MFKPPQEGGFFSSVLSRVPASLDRFHNAPP